MTGFNRPYFSGPPHLDLTIVETLLKLPTDPQVKFTCDKLATLHSATFHAVIGAVPAENPFIRHRLYKCRRGTVILPSNTAHLLTFYESKLLDNKMKIHILGALVFSLARPVPSLPQHVNPIVKELLERMGPGSGGPNCACVACLQHHPAGDCWIEAFAGEDFDCGGIPKFQL